MPRPRPPHLHRERNRHGKHVWYVRKGKGARLRLLSEFGSDAFNTEYSDAVAGRKPQRGQAVAGSLQWLWDSYRKTGSWQALSPATRRQRENIMLHVIKISGQAPFGAITSNDIVAGLDRRADTPSAARNFLDTMRGLFRWARARGHVRSDPTSNVKPPKRRRNAGFAAWTHEDISAYQTRWPLGTRQRVWLDVLLYTGLRRGDAAMVGNQHVSEEGIISILTEKTGTPVVIPMLTVLQRSLLAGPRGTEAWIVGARGKPFVKEAFGNEFSDAARAAGVDKSAHGVRKIAATIAAENGATEAELDAIFGWTGGRMSAVYTRSANRAKLAALATKKLVSIPAPLVKVRDRADNTLSNQHLSKVLVGEEVVEQHRDINYLRKSAGVVAPLARKDNFKHGPHRYTYFILGSEGIKIGQSLNPRARKTELQPGSAIELKLLLAVPYERIPEPEAHKKFKHLRMRGEWFRPDPELLDFIEVLRLELKPHPGGRVRKGSTEIEAAVTGLLKQRRGASQVKKNLIHNMIQQLRNYSAEEDPVVKANLERMIAYTARGIEQAA